MDANAGVSDDDRVAVNGRGPADQVAGMGWHRKQQRGNKHLHALKLMEAGAKRNP